MGQSRKILFLLTESWPYGKGEVFVDNEIPFLAKAFENIIVFTHQPSEEARRSLPDNVKVVEIPADVNSYNPGRPKLSCTRFGVFSILKELWDLVFRYKLSPGYRRLQHLLFYIRRSLLFTSFLQKELEQTRCKPCEILVYSYWYNSLAAGGALFKKNNPETAFLCRTHGFDLYFERHILQYLPLRRFVAENADSIFPVSSDGVDYLKKKLPARLHAKISLSRLGVSSRGRTPHPVADEKYCIVSCSNLVDVKRVHFIVESLVLLPADLTVCWVHFGGGPLEAEIKMLAQELLGRKHHISFNFKGARSNQEVLEFYTQNAINVFMNVSSSEGLPVSIMEAMAHGIPVIATRAGGTEEIVKNNLNGVLLPVEAQPRVIANTLINFFNLPAEEQKMFRENAYMTWKEEFDMQKNNTRFVEKLKSLS